MPVQAEHGVQPGACDVRPFLYPLVPVVGERKRVSGGRGVEVFCPRDESGHDDAQRKRASAAVLFPAVLWAEWPVLRQIADGAGNHGLGGI